MKLATHVVMFQYVNSQKHSNDRFIPRRMQLNLDIFNNDLPSDSEIDNDSEFINASKIIYNRNNFQKTLRDILLPLDLKILNFFPPKKNDIQPTLRIQQMWPVKARKKPIIGPPEIILDMPQFDSHICHHVADWSSKNCLATIFEHEVHMWYPDSEFRSVTNTRKKAQYCVKWKSSGTQFALGLFPNSLGIWDVPSKKLIGKTSCCIPFCDVFCLEWITDIFLISGCSKGVLKIHTNDLKCLKKVCYAHRCSITNIASSCNKTYMATSGMDKTVVVWKIPSLECYFLIEFSCIVRALAWHPWKNFLLAIGNDHVAGHVVLWNINTQKKVAQEENVFKYSDINCLTFNPISGELVVSYFVTRGTDQSRNEGRGVIVVLSNINRTVEELHFHNGPIPYLLWGSEGKKLASASADENLCIWNFFGTKEDVNQKSNARHIPPSPYINSNLLRTYIR